MKRDVEDGLDVKSDRAVDDEEWESSDKRKHRSSRSRKLSNGEDAEGLDGRRRSSGDRNEGRKRSGGSSRAGSDEEDHDSRKESRSKQIKKRQEENTLEKLSNWYQDGELENKKDGVDKLGSRGHGRADESEKRKTASKFSEHEGSQSRIKSKEFPRLSRLRRRMGLSRRYPQPAAQPAPTKLRDPGPVYRQCISRAVDAADFDLFSTGGGASTCPDHR